MLDDEELEMLVVLRMNRHFIKDMRAHSNHLTAHERPDSRLPIRVRAVRPRAHRSAHRSSCSCSFVRGCLGSGGSLFANSCVRERSFVFVRNGNLPRPLPLGVNVKVGVGFWFAFVRFDGI